MKVLCFGDSNTYGFDPRDFFGGRYDAQNRWCDLLAQHTGWQVINCGENGRMIPADTWAYRELEHLMQKNTPVDLLLIMLGTNDILLQNQTDVRQISIKMERVLTFMKGNFPQSKILLVTPPRVAIPAPDLCDAVANLAVEYNNLTIKHNILYCDANKWPLPLACDGVHLSEAGHRMFAAKMKECLQELAL